MTDLQLGSLIVAGAVVGAVYAFNWWQEYRYRKQTQQAFARNQPDVLLDTPRNMVRPGERLEPALDEPTRFALPVDDDAPQAEPAAFEVPPPRAAPQPEPRRTPGIEQDRDALAESLLDPTLDFIAELHARECIPAQAVPHFPGTKRTEVIGLSEAGHWEALGTSDAQYTELRIALQLVDRQGPLSAEQLNSFCMAVQQFADAQDAVATFPQRSAKLAAARDLDEFCASVDVLIGLNVLSNGRPFPMEKVRLMAEKAGLARAPDGNFVYKSESGKLLFTLANQNQTPLGATSDGLTLLFDVPRVAGGLAVFDYLAEFAQQLATNLGGVLADDNGRPLAATSLDNIRRQLARLYATMDDRGIAPGSVAALRLFA
ncbi:cell division protein FtsZ [Chitiniphilus purpureus]|uniref:Cell division protein ZipA n=1 Tax=Chitiniphilus purpureus TaxID=2981137 RepID=A0ABY6DI30_9NEIS|nr:cell division protein ZipA C-terminal FtsZ-binding domain-containing protein [Chitiniphilus sp. CD1]UXY14002.1 cell division protein FtsZ [Chitiniphilus sp. CD1]